MATAFSFLVGAGETYATLTAALAAAASAGLGNGTALTYAWGRQSKAFSLGIGTSALGRGFRQWVASLARALPRCRDASVPFVKQVSIRAHRTRATLFSRLSPLWDSPASILASPTIAVSVRAHLRVFDVIRMPQRTMGGTVISTRKTIATPLVDSICNGLKMIWSNTSSVPTKMIDFFTRRDWPFKQQVRKSVGWNIPLIIADRKRAIPLVAFGGEPQPARAKIDSAQVGKGSSRLINLNPEPFFRGCPSQYAGLFGTPVSVPPMVMHGTHALAKVPFIASADFAHTLAGHITSISQSDCNG